METVFGLLLILLPLTFKVVEKRLQASGKPVEQSGSAGLPEEDFDPGAEIFCLPVIAAVQEESAPEADVQAVSAVSPAPEKAVRPRPAVRMDKLAGKQPEKKIDPKKLIVYSEIMKPKYTGI